MGVDGVYDGLKCSSDLMQDGWGTDSLHTKIYRVASQVRCGEEF